jgi:hypothetical protein
MMDFPAYEAAMLAWVEAQAPAGLDLTAQFRNRQGGWQSKTRALLNVHTSRSVGVDKLRHQQDVTLPEGADLVPTVTGERQLTLSVLVQSRDQRSDQTARYVLEKLRTSLAKPSVLQAFRAAKLGFSRAEAIVDLDRHLDDRIESMASMDVHFNAVVNERDTAEADGFPERAGIAAELTSPADLDVGWDEIPFGDV